MGRQTELPESKKASASSPTFAQTAGNPSINVRSVNVWVVRMSVCARHASRDPENGDRATLQTEASHASREPHPGWKEDKTSLARETVHFLYINNELVRPFPRGVYPPFGCYSLTALKSPSRKQFARRACAQLLANRSAGRIVQPELLLQCLSGRRDGRHLSTSCKRGARALVRHHAPQTRGP